jgi:two-component system, NtrC family, response regulator HydG
MSSVLIVDDLTAIHEMLAAVIQPTGYSMAFADNGEDALRKYKAEAFDVVLADISMQPMDGIVLLQQLKAFDPESVVIMMTGYASTDTAIKALKHGAFDYIQKPFKIDELIQTLKRAVEFGTRNRRKRGDTGEVEPRALDLGDRIVGKSVKIQRLRQQISKLIAVQTPLLLEGETGTGKRTLAEGIHEGGGSGGGPFFMVDCGLNTEAGFRTGLIGASVQGGEWMTRARGGTLFLQHVDRLPWGIQEAFVGVMKRTINETRLICAADVSLESLVDEGRFNDELFYRIATLPVLLPPLREHLEDLPLLVKHFLQQARNPTFDAAQIEFDPETLEAMKGYRWPGNLLELGQLVSSLASTTESRVIGVDQLPPKFTQVEGWPKLDAFLSEQAAGYIRRVLHACGGDKAKAARVLGCAPEKVEQAV